MLRVAEQYTGTDTGRQRRANEDALLARAPLYVVADGMGGAQAGEVASRIAVEVFQPGLRDAAEPEEALAALARVANARIHELSHSNAEQAGMGTTLTAVYVGEHDVAVAHVGDSRAYRLRDGQLLRLTDDHTLVDELLRQGRLTPEEAVEHPQRSVITRALGPEGAVEVDTRSFPARDGDIYLVCSDGLTTMVPEQEILGELLLHPRLHDAGEALIRRANDAGGRDNVTVVLLRVEEVGAAVTDGAAAAHEHDENTVIGLPAVHLPGAEPHVTQPAAADGAAAGAPAATQPRADSTAEVWHRTSAARRIPRRGPPPGGAARKRRLRIFAHTKTAIFTVIVLGLLFSGAWLALQNVYFIGTDARGLVTMYQGVPYQLPGGLDLYSRQYVSGVSAARVPTARRKTLLNHALHTESNAASIVRSLEVEQLE